MMNGNEIRERIMLSRRKRKSSSLTNPFPYVDDACNVNLPKLPVFENDTFLFQVSWWSHIKAILVIYISVTNSIANFYISHKLRNKNRLKHFSDLLNNTSICFTSDCV